jgi:putative transcription factor
MKGRGRNITIEGAQMNVCPQCASKFAGDSGRPEKTSPSSSMSRPSWVGRPDTSPERPRHTSTAKPHIRPKPKPRRGGPLIDELVLIEDYAKLIRSTRQKRGLSQEDLAQRVGERISTLQSIESGRLKPTGKTIRGLERELEITLLEPIGAAPLKITREKSAGGPTLGDVVKVKRKKSQKSE